MKNTLSIVLGIALALGVAAPARTASQVDISGYSRSFYMTDHNCSRNYNGSNGADSYFITRLDVDVVFRPADEIGIYWRLRAPDLHRWGGGQSEAKTKFIYGKVEQEWGAVCVGRLDAPDQLGLASLGYIPASADFGMTRLGPFDSSDDQDSLWYHKTWNNGFGLTAYYTLMAAQPDAANPIPPTLSRFPDLLIPQTPIGPNGIPTVHTTASLSNPVMNGMEAG